MRAARRAGMCIKSVAGLIVAALCLGACGNNPAASIGSSTGGGGTLPNGSMSATINSIRWTAASIQALRAQVGGTTVVTITATDNVTENTAQTISLVVNTLNAPGTFQASSDGAEFGVRQGNALDSWSVLRTLAGSSGSVTFTTLDATQAIGTFTFIAVPGQNSTATGTKIVAAGVFNVKFSNLPVS